MIESFFEPIGMLSSALLLSFFQNQSLNTEISPSSLSKSHLPKIILKPPKRLLELTEVQPNPFFHLILEKIKRQIEIK
jgi:hypothetical protein